MTLGATNTYSGPTTVSAGTLTANTGGAFSSNSAFVVPSGGTLNLAGFSQSIQSLSDGGGAGGSVTIGNVGAGTLTLGADNTSTTFSGVISGTGTNGGLTKNGTGTFTLAGSNTYSNASDSTKVNNGILAITGALSGVGAVSATGGTAPGGAFGILSGNGTIAGPVTINAGSGGGSNGVVSPGILADSYAGLDTLTLTGGLTLPGTYDATVNPDNSASSDLAITGNLNLSGANSTLNLSFTDGDTVTGTYTLATFTGTLTGTFATVNNLPSGYAVDYNPSSITLAPVPEPGSIALLACAGVTGGLGWRGTRLRVARRCAAR